MDTIPRTHDGNYKLINYIPYFIIPHNLFRNFRLKNLIPNLLIFSGCCRY